MQEPIRVVHIITRMIKGGAQENTLATVAGINGQGWESVLVTGPTRGPEGSLEPECQARGIRMLRVPELVREVSPWNDLTALRRLIALCRRERPHIVHTHTSKAGILGRLAARCARVPVVVHTAHQQVFSGYGGRLQTTLFIQAERACSRLADRIIGLTDSSGREYREMGLGRREQWVTVHSGVDFTPFEACRGQHHQVRAELGLSEEATVIGTVGRLVPVKGQRYLIEAVARLAARYPRLQLLLIGDGPLRIELMAQARSLGLRVVRHPAEAGLVNPEGPCLHMLGLRRDVPRLLTAVDLFALPSLSEAMGRALVEAMAMELPCVASWVNGIPDVVAEGVTGFLVPPRDSEALARAMAVLLDDPERARAMGQQGRRKVVPALSVERMIQQLEHLYCELLHGKGITTAPYLPLAASGSEFRTPRTAHGTPADAG